MNKYGPPDHEKDFFERLPEKFRDASLETCDRHSKSLIEHARTWAKKPESVILTGPPGRGKTYFAFSMVREAMRNNRFFWPKYLTASQLDAKLLAAVKSEESDASVLKDIGDEKLLFIDDFGRETRSERMNRQYFELINARYANNLPTIISTNMTMEMIGSSIGDAIASRFQEWQTIEFSGPDLRVKKKII
jgi:DNA replication protein DnaC